MSASAQTEVTALTDPLAAEAVRVYRRYAVEIVEALGFCPYAERCRLDGRTREVVLADAALDDAAVLEAVEAIADDESVEIGLVLFPRLVRGRVDFGRWVEVLRKAHAHGHGGTTVLAIEGFHPDAAPDLREPALLTPFVRRTPDPTLQLTRLSVLDRIRRASPSGTAFFDLANGDLDALARELDRKPPLHERIAETNLETVERLGAGDVQRRMDDILRDRDASYHAIDPTVVARVSACARG